MRAGSGVCRFLILVSKIRGCYRVMRSLSGMVTGRGDRQLKPEGRIYSRSHVSSKPRPPEAQNILKHPVISILLRIDELKHRDQSGHGVKQQAEQTIAELEACLAAIQGGAS